MGKLLIDYLPPILGEVREMRTVMDAEQPEVDQLWAAFRRVLDAGFIQNADSKGLSRWEKMIGIRPKGTDTLESRRVRILARINELLPYTFRALRQMLAALCGPNGFRTVLYPERYYLEVYVALSVKGLKQEVQALLERVVPANIVLFVSLDYNQYRDLHPYTHEQISRLSYQSVRDDPRIKEGNL